MQAVLKEGNDQGPELTFGDYKLKVNYEKPDEPCFGIIIQTSEEEFTVIGMNLKIFFESAKKGEIGHIGQVWEGRYENEQWVPTRLMNGDETWHNAVTRVFGRTFKSSVDLSDEEKKQGNPNAYSPETKKVITTPGVYKVMTYRR